MIPIVDQAIREPAERFEPQAREPLFILSAWRWLILTISFLVFVGLVTLGASLIEAGNDPA